MTPPRNSLRVRARSRLRGLSGLLLALLMVAMNVASPGSASAQLVTTDLPAGPSSGPRGAHASLATVVTLTLTWHRPAQVRLKQQGADLLLSSDVPLDLAGFSTLSARLQPWLTELQVGYDSLVLRLRPGVTASTRTSPTETRITLRQPHTPQASHGSTQGRRFNPAAARRRLRFLKAALLWSTGDAWAASRLLSQMQLRSPEDAELWSAAAVAELRLGRWRRASAALARASSLQGLAGRGATPPAGSVAAPKATLRLRSTAQSDGVNQVDITASGHTFVAPGLRLESRYSYAETPQIQASHWIQAGARQDFTSGSWLAARGIATSGQQRQVGAAAEINRWDPWGETRLDLAWQTPNWALPALTALGATRSAIGLRRHLRSLPALGRPLAGDVSAEASLHLERWQGRHTLGLTATSETAPSTTLLGRDRVDDLFVAATLRYISWRSQPKLWVSYTFIYLRPLNTCVSINDRCTQAATDPQQPGAVLGVLPQLLSQSQVHSLNIGGRVQLWRWLELSAHGGYGVRFGGANAGQLGATLSWMPPLGLRAALSYERGFQASTYGVQTRQFMGRLTYAL